MTFSRCNQAGYDLGDGTLIFQFTSADGTVDRVAMTTGCFMDFFGMGWKAAAKERTLQRHAVEHRDETQNSPLSSDLLDRRVEFSASATWKSQFMTADEDTQLWRHRNATGVPKTPDCPDRPG